MRLVPDRATLRALARSPVFTVVAVLSLALAIGVTTTAYSIVDAVEHPPVIGSDPAHAFSIFPKGLDRDRRQHLRDMYAALYAHRDLFASFAVESPEWTTVIANGQPVWAQVEQVSANYFDVLGVKPAIGQGLRPTDADHPEGAGALLGYAMW
ncbi:MAG: ABC transporter permease, partial [Gemmatimonadota bacterium]|nr:ABC transporter permease [Gemmatimonadota bacterium]